MKQNDIIVIFEGDAYETMQLIELIKEKNIDAWTNEEIFSGLNPNQKTQIIIYKNDEKRTLKIINPKIKEWDSIDDKYMEDIDEPQEIIDIECRTGNEILTGNGIGIALFTVSIIFYYFTFKLLYTVIVLILNPKPYAHEEGFGLVIMLFLVFVAICCFILGIILCIIGSKKLK